MYGKWIAKAAVQKSISALPNPQRANYFFQRHITHSTTLAQGFLNQRIIWSRLHLEAFDRMGGERRDMVVAELGSGWYPILPLCYFLVGASTVWMLDLEDLTRPELVIQAVDGLLDASEDGRLDNLGVDAERLERLRELAQRTHRNDGAITLGSLGIKALPGDARTIELPASPDLITSNTVLEHIDAISLEGILRRFAEIAHPGMVMSHLIDHCDHYAYTDSSLSVYHFLQYSDRAWRLIDNSVQPMNRLRASEYIAMYERVGIPVNEEVRHGCDPTALIGTPLSPRFRSMDPSDVSCTSSHIVTRFD